MLLGSVTHATGFAILGALVYLAMRRLGPAAGALVSSSTIMIMAVVSLIDMGPWPRWWVMVPRESRSTASATAFDLEQAAPPLELRADRGSRPRSAGVGAAPRVPGGPRRLDLSARAESAVVRLLGELARELQQPAAAVDRQGWRWPGLLAVGFLLSLCLGLGRLSLGIWTIQGLRARSQPIADGGLDEAIEIIRAELSCTARVEPRQTAELATPATIGWRRPILLLPSDWRAWDEVERRAVLAHELAHVRRRDFLVGLAAQLGLALHFYHPLAHWLVSRLRLEQELAADAWSASLSGGKSAYLVTLARMALRRDTRTLTWPARAFLPARGTFVRRIDMLRNVKGISHASLPAAARLLTIALLSGLGLLIAGLRGPAGWSSVQAQAPAATRSETAVTTRGSGEAYNLAYLPADAKMIVAVRPQSLLQRPDLRPILESMKRSPAFQKMLLVPPEDVEQLMAFWEGIPQGPVQPGRSPLVPFPSGVVLRMAKPQQWRPLLNQLLDSPREVSHDGQTYLSPDGPERFGVFAADDRTLVVAQEDLLRELIEDRKAPAHRYPWDEAWNKVVKGQMMVAVDTRWVRRRIAQGLQGGPPAPGAAAAADLKLDTISPLLYKARAYALGIDASDRLTVDLVAATGSDEDTKAVASTLQAVLTLGKNAVDGMRRDRRGQTTAAGTALEWSIEAADSLLDQARLEIAGSYVQLRAKAPLDLAGGIKHLAPAIVAANTAQRRNMSANNLKQIALAFHNYHGVKQVLPTPVLYGGATGRVPYSWRVALLPYLEQQQLYNRYNFDEPWDGPTNRKLLDQMPAVYAYPGPDGNPSSRTNTSYFVFSGAEGATCPTPAEQGQKGGESGSKGPTFLNITDGTSNTILAVEAQRDIPWTKPEDIPFDPNGAIPALGGFMPDGFNVAFADGSVRYAKQSISPIVLKSLITRSGGEVVSSDLEVPTPTPTRPPKP
jgi:prepilin-type processing-associated H-X9-DG protein